MNSALANKSYTAHGKLLITGEYLVLHGATALTMPLKYGQTLTVDYIGNKELCWIAYRPDGVWFSATFDGSLNLLNTTDKNLAIKLQNILQNALQIGGLSCECLIGNKITTQLQFQPEWGFGSSSTLISLISQWLNVNPYQLLEATFGGSGYDIAIATANKPITYQRPTSFEPLITKIDFNPTFRKNIVFFYLGQKQTSSSEVIKFKSIKPNSSTISEINDLTKEILQCPTLFEFEHLLLQHEKIISEYIGMPSLNKIIEIPSATIKSLGAWGGDFAMIVAENIDSTKQLLHKMGYSVQFNFDEIIYREN